MMHVGERRGRRDRCWLPTHSVGTKTPARGLLLACCAGEAAAAALAPPLCARACASVRAGGSDSSERDDGEEEGEREGKTGCCLSLLFGRLLACCCARCSHASQLAHCAASLSACSVALSSECGAMACLMARLCGLAAPAWLPAPLPSPSTQPMTGALESPSTLSSTWMAVPNSADRQLSLCRMASPCARSASRGSPRVCRCVSGVSPHSLSCSGVSLMLYEVASLMSWQ